MSSGNWSGYFKIVTPQSSATKMTDSQEMGDVGAYNNYTWYQRLIQGSASRMTRYREYDLMDNDIEVSRALDTIAEEMTGNNPKTKEPLKLDILTEDEDNVESTAVLTLKAALRRWGQLHDFPSRLYSTARLMVKYGDVFFRKGEKMGSKWQFIHPKNVIAAVVSEHDVTKIIAWQIKNDIQKPKSGGYSMPLGAKQDQQQESEIIPANQIIRFSLSDDMSDTQPFGESILRAIYRSHKQKELLEDAVLIYRIQRAPERRVFYIDVGKMHPGRVKQYLENIKNEIKQKKIPTLNGGQQQVDSTYNPHSMCLALDTEIPLLDGRTLTLQEMINEHESGKENWVYSINPKTGEVVPGIVSWAGVTRKNAETIRLILDNGEEIVCTPDHKFPIQGKEGKVEAKDITPEDSLYPFKIQSAESSNLNLHVVRIEKGEAQDTGTLTIDGDEKYHNYHTFATTSSFLFNSEDFYFACISMKTSISLLDGRTLTLEELTKEYDEGKENWTYSVDQKTGKLIAGKIDWAGYTRRNAEMVRVYIDNGETMDVTPDHKFVLKDGSEVEAQNLTPDMSLMPLYKKYLRTNKNQNEARYEQILDNETGKWKFTHLEIMPKIGIDTVMHHFDYNSFNNSPTNLLEMDKTEHWKLHSENGHTFAKLWKDDRQKMLDGIRRFHANRTPEQDKMLSDRNRKNGANTWLLHEEQVRENLKRGNGIRWDSFASYGEYCASMSEISKIQWTDEKRKIKTIETISFNKKTKTYFVDDKLYKIFLDVYNQGNNSMPKIKAALRSSITFKEYFKEINNNNQNVRNNKPLNFSDKFVYKIVKYAGFDNFNDFKQNYAINHKILKVEKLTQREDTGCLHVIDEGNNHNFAVAAGVYIKNSRPDGRGSKVETLPGGQGLGELTDLEYFQHKIWRGLKIPISYMQESADGGSVWNDGKVGIAYIQELRFSLYIERLQAYMERVIDVEFKAFLRSANIRIDETMYRILLPEPSNFGKYRQLELDSQLLSAYTTANGIHYFSPRFTMKRYLQMSDEEIITNERLKREELGIDPDSKDPADLKLIYGAPEEAGMGGAGGGLGGGFGGAELGMGAEPIPEGGEGGASPPPEGTPK